MFNEKHEGIYKDQVHWFAGVADNVVHVTLYTNNDNIFYDFMTSVHGEEDFHKQLSEMCDKYIERFLTPIKEITNGETVGQLQPI